MSCPRSCNSEGLALGLHPVLVFITLFGISWPGSMPEARFLISRLSWAWGNEITL